MALKFMACTIRAANPTFADQIIELWYEYEQAESTAAVLARQIDKLECIQQAVIYEERTEKDMSEFMYLKAKITLPELQPLLKTCLQRYEELKARRQANIVVILVSGGPGVGKGTQCARLAAEFGLCHISVGDLLREEAKDPASLFADFIPESIRKSVLLPAQLTTQLLKREMGKAQEEGIRTFLLDGFPRSVSQATDFELKICKKYSTLSFECSEAEMQQRLEARSKSSNRIDDNPESIVRRLATFNENNAPVLQYLSQRGPVHQVQCSGSIDDVYARVHEIVQRMVPQTD